MLKCLNDSAVLRPRCVIHLSKPDQYCDSVLYELHLKNKTLLCEFIGENKRQVRETGSNSKL